MTERERLIELLEHNRENPFETCPQYGTDDYCVGCKYDELDDCSTHRLADYLLANGVGVLSYNLHLPKELYRHMFDEKKRKVVVKCRLGKNTGYSFSLIHYLDGREWEYKYTSIGKTVFLTKEEAEQALKGGGKE